MTVRDILIGILITLVLVISNEWNKEDKMESVFFKGESTIRITLSEGEIRDKESIRISENNEDINIIEFNELSARTYELELSKKIDLTREYFLNFNEEEFNIRPHWKLIDKLYFYDGELGALYEPGQTEFKLWAPLATKVNLRLFNDGQDETPYDIVTLSRTEKGVWTANVKRDIRGQFYTYEVTNYGETKEVLDPYAKSMAVTTDNHDGPGKGAIVSVSDVGPELDFAKMEGYEKREDAVIWEIHVRDFTVDPDIHTRMPFGTYRAFIEKLDYIKALGVSHVQLLPVLSYRWGDELASKKRMMEYKVGSNYNWGYDPHNYFSPEGMYSTDPRLPELRIRELKELIKGIHIRGMGVTLDVVYNHTASLALLEDIVPGYYHFMDAHGNPKQSYGGGRPGTTHAMTRKLVVDSIVWWTREYKVDGFRYDLMGDLDAETVQIAFDEAKKINPNMIMVGEGWRTYTGDDGENAVPADQDWMGMTSSASSFSDEMRNELKSGFGSEGQPRFITGGPRNIQLIFDNIIAKPRNMTEDDPGDVLQYIAAHDNLTLHDVIAQSIQKDPAHHEEEIQKRIRLGNAIILTSQGTAFLHGGQEYGRTKQWLDDTIPEGEYTEMKGFEHPYFIHNSYNASDAVNMFDWDKVTEPGIHKQTMEYTSGLIKLRRSTDAFRLGTEEQVSKNVHLISSPDIKEEDLVIAYSAESTSGEVYHVFINADSEGRSIRIGKDLTEGVVLTDAERSGVAGIKEPVGVKVTPNEVTIDPLTVVVIKSN